MKRPCQYCTKEFDIKDENDTDSQMDVLTHLAQDHKIVIDVQRTPEMSNEEWEEEKKLTMYLENIKNGGSNN
jgi:hypothetical protein